MPHSTAANGKVGLGLGGTQKHTPTCLPHFLWFGIFTPLTLHNNEMQNSEKGIIEKCFQNLSLSKEKTNATIPDINHWRELPGFFERRTYLHMYIYKALFTPGNLLYMNIRGNCRRSYISAL